jgi:hypothetical protein
MFTLAYFSFQVKDKAPVLVSEGKKLQTLPKVQK